MGIRVDYQGVVHYDYQTIEGVPDTKGKGAETVVSERWFLSDAVFLVVLKGDPTLLGQLADAITRPVFPLALGRKSYVPTEPIVLGLKEDEPHAVLRTHPWLVSAKRLRRPVERKIEAGEEVRLRLVYDCPPQDASAWYLDYPLSFQPRRFLRRPVRIEEVPLRPDMLRGEDLAWRST
jgi:CRISPR system Cascade subunit CasD